MSMQLRSSSSQGLNRMAVEEPEERGSSRLGSRCTTTPTRISGSLRRTTTWRMQRRATRRSSQQATRQRNKPVSHLPKIKVLSSEVSEWLKLSLMRNRRIRHKLVRARLTRPRRMETKLRSLGKRSGTQLSYLGKLARGFQCWSRQMTRERRSSAVMGKQIRETFLKMKIKMNWI